MTIGERIGCLRKQLKMSRRIFGERLGVSESVIVNIEFDRLKRPEQKESLYKLICKEFEVSEHWLRTGEGEMFLPMTRGETIAKFAGELMKDEDDSFRKRLVEALAMLNEEQWEVLESIAKTLTKEKD